MSVMITILTEPTNLDISQVQAVDGVLRVPLEPHDEADSLGGGGGGVAGQRDAPPHVTQHLDTV